MIVFGEEKHIEKLILNNTEYPFNGKGPYVFGAKEAGLDSDVVCESFDDRCVIRVTVSNPTQCDAEIDRLGLYLGVDCLMESYPQWNDRLFPTLLHCDVTQFYGYFMSPSGNILGIASPDPFDSYTILYNGLGHRIDSVELDFFHAKASGSKKILRPGESIHREIRLFSVDTLESFEKTLVQYVDAPLVIPEKFTVEPGEPINVFSYGDKTEILTPDNRVIPAGSAASDYGTYTVRSYKNGRVSQAKVYCRRDWSWYLKAAADASVSAPQKATTHCESWYGLYSGYLAAKHEPETGLEEKTEKVFREIMPYMFDFDKGEPVLIPQRIQNAACLVGLLADRYECDPETYADSLDIADKFVDYLISVQKEDGAYYRDGNKHYTCVIYIAKSIFELYLAVKNVKGFEKRAEKYYRSVKKAIDNLVRMLDNIGTEGEQTFEDGMISCSALQIAMFALDVDGPERQKYVDAAEYMIKRHACLEQNRVPDCRMRNASLRFWEAQYDVLIHKNMMNSPHGWTAWTLYAKYYLYLLTHKAQYLKELMDGMGACVQLVDGDGNLNWGFLCDPCVEADVFVKDKKLENGYSGRFEKRVLGSEYIPMISGWFRHNEQKVTGGFLECPLIRKDGNVQVSKQGGCCDNDVHEIFKCLEETVLKKAFLHETDGTYLCYSCDVASDVVTLHGNADTLCYSLESERTFVIKDQKRVLSGNGVLKLN